MNKYEQAKYLKLVKSRTNHICFSCGRTIKKGDYYYKETLDFFKPPSIILKEFCIECGKLIINNNN